MNRYKVGDVINNFEIQGINTERRYVRYYCKCLLCGNNYLYLKYSLVRNKGNGCQRCSHRVDTNDIVGKTFNAWKVLKRLEKVQDAHKQKYLCECNLCGNVFESFRYDITDDSHKYCGKCFRDHIYEYKKNCNGRTKTRIYRLWQSMKARCYYEKDLSYHNYGGRGIKVCDEWLGKYGFENFKNWAFSNGYKEEVLPNGKNKWTLDRIDVNLNYSPDNCRFITIQDQMNNTRKNVYYDFQGQKLTLTQICRIKGLNINTIENRINNHNWTLDEALNTPIRGKRASRLYKWERKEFEYNGELLSKNDICERFNLTKQKIWKRLAKGFSIKELIEVPSGMPINKWRKMQESQN